MTYLTAKENDELYLLNGTGLICTSTIFSSSLYLITSMIFLLDARLLAY